MPDGELVCCYLANNSVKVFTPDFKLKNGITIGALLLDVAVVSKNELIVTTPTLNRLQLLTVRDRIKKGKYIPTEVGCCGIDCKNERLYVSCHENHG